MRVLSSILLIHLFLCLNVYSIRGILVVKEVKTQALLETDAAMPGFRKRIRNRISGLVTRFDELSDSVDDIARNVQSIQEASNNSSQIAIEEDDEEEKIKGEVIEAVETAEEKKASEIRAEDEAEIEASTVDVARIVAKTVAKEMEKERKVTQN